ncbi:MAG TPA: hypothetical protein VFC25_02280 [Verrucomicrobiae bacterium]|nr:hypothetical protein [Verrucomicrobiae bacterium]
MARRVPPPRFLEDLTADERRLFRRLRTPSAIQDYLDRIPTNFETHGQTCRSPRGVIRAGVAHCLEAALLAAAASWFHGRPPLLVDLKARRDDFDHVVAPFLERGRWGAISKTNHAVLRWRDPVYASVRELAMSYFHEYFKDNGRKTLVSHSGTFDLSRRDPGWVTSSRNLWHLQYALDMARHYPVAPPRALGRLRPAAALERRAGLLVEWRKPRAAPRRGRRHAARTVRNIS